MNVSVNITNSTNVTSFFQELTVEELHTILGITLILISILLKLWYDMKHKNYFELKREHIDKLTTNILNRWRYVSCELVRDFAVDRNFILLNGYQRISQHKEFKYAVEHIKKYSCWDVWTHIMESFNNVNISASKMLHELNEAISNRINTDLSTSDITIAPLSTILDQVVKILIDNSGKNRECDEYIIIDAQAKWVEVQTDRVYILAERGDMQDLETFKRIICEFIRDEHYRNKVIYLLLQFENIRKDVRTFTEQMSHIASVAEHTRELKGKCKACPRILWVFSP